MRRMRLRTRERDLWRDNRWRTMRSLNDEIEFGDNVIVKSYARALASALVAAQPPLKRYERRYPRTNRKKHTFNRASLMRNLLDEISFGDSIVKLYASMLASALVVEEPALNERFNVAIWKFEIYTIRSPERIADEG